MILRHFDRVSVDALVRQVLDAVRSQGDDLGRRLLVLSPARVRVRDL
jgi:hypothetical protein